MAGAPCWLRLLPGGSQGAQTVRGGRILAAPWAGGTHLWCFCILASPSRKIEGVGAAAAVRLMGGLGSGGLPGLPAEQEGASLGPATAAEIRLPRRDPSPACRSLTMSCLMLL